MQNGSPETADPARIGSDRGPNGIGSTELAITEFAALIGVSVRTLRFYERRGLLSPRRMGRSRIYSERDRQQLLLILKAKRLGFTLGEIKDMLASESDHDSARSLRLPREKCLEQIALLEQRISDLTAALAELRRLHASLCKSPTCVAQDVFPVREIRSARTPQQAKIARKD